MGRYHIYSLTKTIVTGVNINLGYCMGRMNHMAISHGGEISGPSCNQVLHRA